MKSTKAMRDRIRELMPKAWDDYDRAVDCVLEDLETSLVRIEALEAALRVFADPLSWRRDGSCDPNSGRFEGQSIASTTLAPEQDK
jgi:hypothetical protein